MLATVAVSVLALVLIAYQADLLRTLELTTVNTRFQLRGEQPPPADVVIVSIDARTFDELNLLWPFERRVHAHVLEEIAREHPKLILYDVQFSEPSPCPPRASGKPLPPGQCPQARSDESDLLSALSEAAGHTVVATTETDERGEARFLGAAAGPLLGEREIGARIGNALLPTDPGGIDRRVSYSVGGLRSMAVVGAEVVEGHPIPRESFGRDPAWIDYYGGAGIFHTVSFSRAYEGSLPSGTFRNKVVVVGPSAPTLQDLHPTSTSSLMPGAEIQANALETVLRGLPLHSFGTWGDIALIVLMALCTPILSVRAGPLVVLAAAVALAGALTVGAQLAFNNGVIISFVYPATALVLSTVGALSVQLVTVAFERERVRDLFSRFVPANVVDEVLASSRGLRLGGVQREGTAMFTDLRSFTSFSETLPPAEVIEVLNNYLTEMSDAILDHGGTLVAYMGDGIFAVFGAPIEQHDHADRALATAREMLDVRLPNFNAWLQERGLGSGFRMGIGLNSGSVLSGNVGSERRVEYAAVGDPTNVAARIEQLTKGTPHQLMLSDATKQALVDPPDDLIFVEEVELRGRRAHTKIWSLRSDADSPPTGDRGGSAERVAGSAERYERGADARDGSAN